MALLINLCLVLISLLGVGAAVGIPITLHAKGKNTAVTSRGSSGGGISTVSVELSECQTGSSDSVSSVEFGSKTTDKVCGKTQDGSESLTNKEEYTQLFKKIGGTSSQSGTGVTVENGKTECSNSGSSWEIGSSGASERGQNEKDEYLGLCDNTSNTGNNLFVKKSTTNRKHTILVCMGLDNCGSLGSHGVSGVSSKKQLQSDKSSSGKTVTFQKSN